VEVHSAHGVRAPTSPSDRRPRTRRGDGVGRRCPRSRSRLIRDLAIRGAEAERDARRREDEAIEHLLSIAHGQTDYDFEAARAIYAEREAGYE
jgi:hypothetical protein